MNREDAVGALDSHDMYMSVSECDTCGDHRYISCPCGEEWEGDLDSVINHVLDVLFPE